MESYNYKMFGCFTRRFKISEVQPPADLLEAFAKYAGTAAADCTPNSKGTVTVHLTSDQLRSFLMEHQGEQDEARAQAESDRIVHQAVQRRGLHILTNLFSRNLGLTVDDFFQYLFDGDLNGPILTEVHHDMTAPLQHYFIYTGHNSYLTGNQLSSDCSDAPIIKALQKGVRVIELDLWPSSTKDEIDVVHGRTLTTPVTLRKCLLSIKDHAFDKSSYPLIITLEDHLTPDLQARVAEMVIEIFGDSLYYPESENVEEFPAPEDLKNRILLSTKPPKEYLDSKPRKNKHDSTSMSKKDSSENGSVSASRERKENGDQSPAKEEKQNQVSPSLEEKKDEQSPPRKVKEDEKSPPRKVKKDETLPSRKVKEDEKSLEDYSDSCSDEAEGCSNRRIAPEYKRLIAIRAGKPKNGLRHALRSGLDKVRRLSLSEEALERAVENYATDVIRFTQRNFLRIYPKGTRIRSSNYEPLVAWTHGAQMVAFNMQGYDKALWLMHGMFRANGGCGYIKKPSFLLNNGSDPENKVFDPKAPMDVKTTLKVRVYMGDGWRQDFSQTHFDTYSPPDFYTKLRLVGAPADCGKKKTRVIEDNWIPVWDEEFSFKLMMPEMALLRIEVREYDRSEKDDFGGQTCLPVSEIKPGFRTVPLFNKKGEKLPHVRLLMRFQFVSSSSF